MHTEQCTRMLPVGSFRANFFFARQLLSKPQKKLATTMAVYGFDKQCSISNVKAHFILKKKREKRLMVSLNR